MNKLKKILSSVLALGLVASTIVLPVSVKADDYIVNETFDGEVIENLFGTPEAAANEIVAGNIIDFKADGSGDKIPVGLDADDKIMKVTGNNAYFNQNGLVEGTPGWGQDSPYTHATYEMDVWFYNGWNKFGMSPGRYDRYGFMFGGSESSAKTSFYIVRGDSKVTDLKTVGRRQWYHVGVEYDYTVSPAVMKVYLDNELLATQELAGERTSVPTDMRLYSSLSQGHNFINNFKFYEGAYRPSALTKTKIQNYDFSDASQCETFTPDSSKGTSSVVAGFAGKAASDQVANVWGGNSGHNTTSIYTYPWDVITYETEVFGQSGKGAMLYNATNDGGARYGLKLQDGKLQVVTCKDWTYEDVEGYTDVDMNSWHKMAVEINGIDGMYYLYFDGVKVAEKSAPDTIGTARTSDARFGGQAYLDNFKVYNKPYETETRVSATPTAKVTVDGSVLKVAEGATADEVKAVVSGADSVIFYSNEAQTVVTDDVNAAKFMAVKKGNLYKSYEVKIQSPYGDKLLWLDFTDAADATTIGAAQVDGFAGKAASDQVAHATATTNRSGKDASFTGNAITYEAQVYVPRGSSSYMHVYNAGSWQKRLAINVTNTGAVKVGANLNSGSSTNIFEETSYSVDANTWTKFAIEINANNDYVKFYMNDECIKTVPYTADLTVISKQFDFETSNTYIDNMRMYTAPYQAGTPIAEVAGASNGVINVPENTTAAAVKAMVTDGTAELYTDATFATVASTVVDDSVLLIKKGELYKTYTINVASKYDGAYYVNTFDTVDKADSLNADAATYPSTIETNVAGRADRVARILNSNKSNAVGAWGEVWNTDKFTAEIMVYNPNHIGMGILPSSGLSATAANRNGINLQSNGTIKMYKQNVQQETTATYDMDKWTKIAYTVCHSEDTMKIYVDGVLVYTYEDLGTDGATYGKDIRLTPSSRSGIYVDNFRCYSGDYKGDEAITFTAASGISLANGVIKVADGTTADAIAATLNADSVAIYADATGAATSAVADGAVVIANKGELYKSYTIDVAGLYDDAVLAVDFDTQAIVDSGSGWAGLTNTSSWAIQNKIEDGALVSGKTQAITPSYVAGLGGKSATDYAIQHMDGNPDLQDNARLQAGYGSANANATGTVYTVEADVYLVEGARNGGIMIKMRNAAGSNIQPTLTAPAVANRWYKLAITVDTEARTVQGYVNGVETDATITELGDYTVFSDQVNANFGEDSTTAVDNFRVYAGAYKSGTAPVVDEKVTMAENSTVAQVLDYTGAKFVVDTNGNVVSSGAERVATGYQAVTVEGEFFAYTTVEVKASAPETVVFNSTPLAVEHYKGANGVDYVMMPVVTAGVVAIEEYKTFVFKAGDDTRAISLSDLPGFTTVDGAVNIGILVMNIPAAAENNWKAMITKTDIANMAKAD